MKREGCGFKYSLVFIQFFPFYINLAIFITFVLAALDDVFAVFVIFNFAIFIFFNLAAFDIAAFDLIRNRVEGSKSSKIKDRKGSSKYKNKKSSEDSRGSKNGGSKGRRTQRRQLEK